MAYGKAHRQSTLIHYSSQHSQVTDTTPATVSAEEEQVEEGEEEQVGTSLLVQRGAFTIICRLNQ